MKDDTLLMWAAYAGFVALIAYGGKTRNDTRGVRSHPGHYWEPLR